MYRIPTERLDADGTFQWDSTTVVLVEAVAESGQRGIGFTYAAASASSLIQELLVPVVEGCAVEDVRAA